jgi:hypothetical protein
MRRVLAACTMLRRPPAPRRSTGHHCRWWWPHLPGRRGGTPGGCAISAQQHKPLPWRRACEITSLRLSRAGVAHEQVVALLAHVGRFQGGRSMFEVSLITAFRITLRYSNAGIIDATIR